MPFGDNPRAGKVNPHNGASVRSDQELFDGPDEFEELKDAYGLSDEAVRFQRAGGLI
jgi:hypothetical protein